jgi:hypothetical protein
LTETIEVSVVTMTVTETMVTEMAVRETTEMAGVVTEIAIMITRGMVAATVTGTEVGNRSSWIHSNLHLLR